MRGGGLALLLYRPRFRGPARRGDPGFPIYPRVGGLGGHLPGHLHPRRLATVLLRRRPHLPGVRPQYHRQPDRVRGQPLHYQCARIRLSLVRAGLPGAAFVPGKHIGPGPGGRRGEFHGLGFVGGGLRLAKERVPLQRLGLPSGPVGFHRAVHRQADPFPGLYRPVRGAPLFQRGRRRDTPDRGQHPGGPEDRLGRSRRDPEQRFRPDGRQRRLHLHLAV